MQVLPVCMLTTKRPAVNLSREHTWAVMKSYIQSHWILLLFWSTCALDPSASDGLCGWIVYTVCSRSLRGSNFESRCPRLLMRIVRQSFGFKCSEINVQPVHGWWFCWGLLSPAEAFPLTNGMRNIWTFLKDVKRLCTIIVSFGSEPESFQNWAMSLTFLDRTLGSPCQEHNGGFEALGNCRMFPSFWSREINQGARNMRRFVSIT